MKNSQRSSDVTRVSIIIGVLLLLILIATLVVTIVFVYIKTENYNKLAEQKYEETNQYTYDDASCGIDIQKRAIDKIADLTITVEPGKEITKSNHDSEGNCIEENVNASTDDEVCPETITDEVILVTISGLKPNYRYVLTNNFNSEEVEFYYKEDASSYNVLASETNKDTKYEAGTNTTDTYSFIVGNSLNIIDYVLKVYYQGEECDDLLILTKNFETPRYNYLSNYLACAGKENIDECKEYIYEDDNLSSSDYNLGDVLKKIEQADPTEDTPEEIVNNRISLVIAAIIVLFVIIIAVIVAVIALMRARRGGTLHEKEVDEEYDEDSSKTFDEFMNAQNEESETKVEDTNLDPKK